MSSLDDNITSSSFKRNFLMLKRLGLHFCINEDVTELGNVIFNLCIVSVYEVCKGYDGKNYIEINERQTSKKKY
jgi:hypothetical protein